MNTFFKKHKVWFYLGTTVFGVSLLGSGLPLLLIGGNHSSNYMKNKQQDNLVTDFYGLLNYRTDLNNNIDFITFVTSYRQDAKRNEIQTLIKSEQSIIDVSSDANAIALAQNAIKHYQSQLDIPLMYDLAIAGAIFTSFGAVAVIGGCSLLYDLKKNRFKKSNSLT